MEKLKHCKITIFGDSIPKGIVYENNQLKRLPENAVILVAKHFDIQIDNLSFYGQTLKRLNQKGTIDKYLEKVDNSENNIAVISLGGNDSDYNWKFVANSPKENHLPNTPPKEFELMLDETIQKLQQKNVKVILTNIPPIDSKRYFENVTARQADKGKVLEFLQGDIENIYRHQEFYSMIITRCATKNNCRLLDIRGEFLWDRKYLDKFCIDGVHPNEMGHEIIAKSIIEQLEKEKSTN